MLSKVCKLIATFLGVGLSLAADVPGAPSQQVAVALDSGSAIPGGTISLNLSLMTSGGAIPTAVQWTMNYPPSVVLSVDVAAGSSLTQAAETLNCSSTAGGTTCIAYSMTQNVINAGPLATVTFLISPNALNSQAAVQVTSVVVAAATGMAIPSSGQAGTISVSQPSFPTLSGLSCLPANLNSPGSSSSTCTASLSEPASSTFTVTLASNNSNVTVPAIVTVPATALSASFTAIVSPVPVAQTAVLTAIAGGTVQTFSLPILPQTQAVPTAVFVKTDTTSQGNWKGMYGADGYNVIDDTVSYPSYVTVTPAGQLNFVWAASTTDVRGLQKALSSTDRIASTWYTYGTFTIDLNFTDGAQHQLAVYCLDWDEGGARRQTVSILDGTTNAPLDSQNITGFQNGKYLVWSVKGHVILQVTNAGGDNAVISGLFFDSANVGSTSNSAAFVKTDTTTQGSWKGVYGANGYNVIDDTVSYPGYATVTPAGQSDYVWAASTSDVRALQKAFSSTDRIASTWYTYGTFTIDLNFTDGAQHQLAVYCLDWGTNGTRQQTVSILDGATNTPLNSQSVTGFQNGKYLVWNVKGHVILQVTNAGGLNAVISGLFFDTASIGFARATPTFTSVEAPYAVASATSTIDSGSGTWYNLSWTNRKAVTIDHTKVSGSSNLANFPVLFSVIDANLKTIANGGSVGKSDGTDILFTAGDGVTKLSHEIERYDPATGELVAWVNIPALSPSIDRGLYLYYGNAAATDQQDRVNTWDSDYKIVNHLKEAGGPVLDSTGNANNATSSGSGAILVSSGKMGSAYSFDGIAGLLTTPSDPSWNGNVSNYTVQLWVKFNSSPPGYSAALAAGGWNGPLNFWFDGSGSITFRMDTTGICQTTASLTPDSTTFHQLVLTYNGAQLIPYIDGVAASSPASCSGTNSLGRNSISLGGFNPGNKLPSIIDEFRISATTRSADWILTEYRNQNSPGTFYAVGPQE